MNQKIKWTGLTLAAICLVSSTPVWAVQSAAQTQTTVLSQTQAQTQTQSQVETQEKDLPLAEAVEIALASNHELNMMRIDVQNADLNARLVNKQIDSIKADSIESLDAAKQKYYNDAQTQMTKKFNQLELKAAERKTRLEVQKLYYAAIKAEKEKDQQIQSLTRTETTLKMANEKLKAGTASKIDVMQAEVGVANAKAALESANNAVTTAMQNLNLYLGTELDQTWKLKDTAQQLNIQLSSLEQTIETALKQRYEIEQSAEEEKLAQLNLELYDKYLSLATYQGEVAKNNLIKAKAETEQTKRNLIVEVTQAYQNLLSYQNSMEMYKKSRDLALQNYNATRIRYENGLATSFDVVEAEEEVTKSENQYNNAMNNYNIAYLTLQNVMGS
ncbi:TolC family protein [Brevibacillus sp. SYSU BS000544]|uniref:TolC family protein n=1 Tax=Brevibacillus sp. SYSU BS000544 TaxID=3416443 RepID=UPI003CE4F8EC